MPKARSGTVQTQVVGTGPAGTARRWECRARQKVSWKGFSKNLIEVAELGSVFCHIECILLCPNWWKNKDVRYAWAVLIPYLLLVCEERQTDVCPFLCPAPGFFQPAPPPRSLHWVFLDRAVGLPSA